jgi:hypothetical protein
VLGIALTVGGLLAVPVSGQSAVDLALDVPGSETILPPGNSTTYEVVVENQGSMDGHVELGLDLEGDGWSASLPEAEMDLAAGEQTRVLLLVEAPTERNASAGLLEGLVQGELTDQSGQFASSDEAEFTAKLATWTPPPPEEGLPWAWILGLGGVSTVGALVGLGHTVWRREAGIRVAVDGPGRTWPGGETHLPVALRNERGGPRMVELVVDETPPGIRAGLNLCRAQLGPGEEKSLWLAVGADEDVEEGTYEVPLRARPEDARWLSWAATAPVRVESP